MFKTASNNYSLNQIDIIFFIKPQLKCQIIFDINQILKTRFYLFTFLYNRFTKFSFVNNSFVL